MSSRAALLILLSAASLSGCLQAQTPERDEPSTSIPPTADHDWDAALVSGPQVWRLSGDGVREYHLRSGTAFTLTGFGWSTGHANATGTRSANETAQSHWLLMRPLTPSPSSGNCAPLTAPGTTAWSPVHVPSSSHGQTVPAGDYVIIAQATEGWIDVYLNGATRDPFDDNHRNIEGAPNSYTMQTVRPHIEESGSPNRAGSFSLGFEAPRAGYLFAELSVYALSDAGSPQAASELRDGEGGLCEGKELAPAAPATSGGRRIEHALSLNHAGTYVWKGNYSNVVDPMPGQSGQAVGLLILPPATP